MNFVYDDGGRADAGFKGKADDCVCRSLAIATERPYKEIYDLINKYGKAERASKCYARSSARTGVRPGTVKKILADLGWKWVPTMQIGSGCQVHLRDEDLPYPIPRIIVNVSGHITTVIYGVVHDTYDCSRDGNRCVYGYWYKE